MFPTNPFPQLTTSTTQLFPPSNFLQDHEKDDHHYINNPFECFPAKETYNFTTTSKQDLVEGLGLDDVMKDKAVASKKDHHSKIHTAQGPRDRRVRLSIEVAKKFFYLQDLLGVDKASKTLDWLFKKSKISIDELIKRKKQTSSSSTLTDRSEVVFLETTGSDQQADKARKKKITRKYKSGVNESRAEARARARERTKNKLNSSVHVDCCSSNLTLESGLFWSSIEPQNDYDDKIGESVMDEDNDISISYSYQHNLVDSNDSISKLTGLPKFTDLHEQPVHNWRSRQQ